MKKAMLCLAFVALISTAAVAQKEHKIVFDFTSNDTASFSMVVRHARNIMKLSPGSQLEFVCHGPGIDILLKGKTTVANDITELSEKLNVVFAACEATMQRKGIDRSQLIPRASTVPAALLEISSKVQDGWTYIKEGH